jgi:vancomycin resistance protein YoaR
MLSNGVISVVPGKDGRGMDVADAAEGVGQILKSRGAGTVALTFQTEPPKYADDDLRFETDCIGWYETAYAPGNARAQNIALAAGRVHNVTLYPGEVFSARERLRTNEPGNGYREAVVIVDGRESVDVGGGVCQVVTTLYNAALYAELPVVERHNHSAMVSYAGYGLDAAIAGDYYDLKFKNGTERPVLITCTASGGLLTVEIYGYESRSPGRSLSFEGRLIETVRPGPDEEKKEPSLAAGLRMVQTPARDGFRYDVYKHIYEDGRAVGTVKVNSSYYKPVRGVVSVGSGGS